MNMKTIAAIAALCLAAPPFVRASALEPVIWADVPDVAPLRVGDTYYMVSTTMHFNPGVPVMTSKDLVNWEIASYCYETVEDRPKDRLEGEESDYMRGTWASSIRYNEADGFFYVTSFNSNVNSTYLFRTRDPRKTPWEFFRLSPKQYDESLWIEDGRFWVYATVPGRPYKVRLTEMKSDFSGFVDEGRIVLDNVTDCCGGTGLGEGAQVFKRNGWYYLVNICWPQGSCRTVVVHRSRTKEGPWEGKVVLEREGIAQGSFVDRPDGSWVAVLFGDRGAVGRIPYILETEWVDDWPVVLPKEVRDAAGTTHAEIPGCVASDEFDGAALGGEWQWNHNPDAAHWSLSERPGFMRLRAGRVDRDILHARNTLTQRTFGPACEGVTRLDFSGLKEGDVAGLALLQKLYGLAAVRVRDGRKELVLWSPDGVPSREKQNVRVNRAVRERQTVPLPAETSVVWLRAVCDFTPAKNPEYTGIPASTDMGKFYWSLDGEKWTPLGDAFDLVYTIPHFIGYRFGLCCFSTKEKGVGGFADFDFLRLAARRDAPFTSDGSNPIVKTRFTPDPAAVVDGEWLYLFTGHDEPDARGYRMKDWGAVRTKDMETWEDLGTVMDTSVFKWAHQGDRAWASQAVKRGDRWYWYVAVQKAGGGDCIGVATAEQPEGPWKDPIGKPLWGPVPGAIDPSVFVEENGDAWLFWGNCYAQPACWYAKLKDSMVELDEEPQPVPGQDDPAAFGPLFQRRQGAAARHRRPVSGFEEAPWIYKVGDTYYLEYAANFPEHWAYSTAKSIRGPWTYGGKIMDCAEGTGTIHGGSVFFKGEWYLVYHNATLEGGAGCRRSACIERYARNADGSIPLVKATKKGVAASEEKAYLFAYFSDNAHGGRRGEAAGLHLACSFDGLEWAALNDDRPFLVPELGRDRLMRDPSICRGPDGIFHLVWTTSWHDRMIGYASSRDLVHWSEQQAIPVMADEPAARNCWAPEVTYNPDDGLFYIYWATTIPGRHSPIPAMDVKEKGLNHRIYLTTTKDFKTFSRTRLWFNPAFSAIDAACVRDEKNGDWIMVVKNENHTPVEKNIRVTRTRDLAGGFSTDVSPKISPDWVEGPSPLFVGDTLYVYIDFYGKHGYGAVRSDDHGKTWSLVPDDRLKLPKGMRHGTAFAVEKGIVDALLLADTHKKDI